MSELKLMPIQKSNLSYGDNAEVNSLVYMKAYEIYKYVHGHQQAMIEGNCRGGFGIGELVAFLYAGNFPKLEWRDRIEEAFQKMKL